MKALILLFLAAVAVATKECGKNQHYSSCGTACPVTCENYKNPPEICIKMCVPGCQCDAGYVKNGDKCVRPEECATMSKAKTCLEEPDTGMCRGYFPMYYYDAKTQTCREFIYGGCMGNGNRYSTEEECLNNCKDIVTWESDSVCDLPADAGMCFGYFRRFHFDKKTGKCTRFIYGGCGGNENNFKTEDECQQKCGKTSDAAPKACLEKKVVGRCDAAFRRFYFNTETGKCEEFIYGGCDGNSNNFNSKAECEAVCVTPSNREACQEDKVEGACKAYFERFFYNKDTGKCEEFIYGGCDGNSNNFNSKEDCESVCVE